MCDQVVGAIIPTTFLQAPYKKGRFILLVLLLKEKYNVFALQVPYYKAYFVFVVVRVCSETCDVYSMTIYAVQHAVLHIVIAFDCVVDLYAPKIFQTQHYFHIYMQNPNIRNVQVLLITSSSDDISPPKTLLNKYMPRAYYRNFMLNTRTCSC